MWFGLTRFKKRFAYKTRWGIAFRFFLKQTKTDCIYYFPIDLESNRIPFWFQINQKMLYTIWFGLVQQATECDFFVWIDRSNTQRNLFEIALNQTEIRLYLQFYEIDFEQQTEAERLLIQINRKMVNTIWFQCDFIRFRKDFSVCTETQTVWWRFSALGIMGGQLREPLSNPSVQW